MSRRSSRNANAQVVQASASTSFTEDTKPSPANISASVAQESVIPIKQADEDEMRRFTIGVQHIGPGNPDATTRTGRGPQQVGAQQLIEVEESDDVRDLVHHLASEAEKALGGELKDWRITLEAEGTNVSVFKKASELRFDHSDPTKFPDAITPKTTGTWSKFKETLGRTDTKSATIKIERLATNPHSTPTKKEAGGKKEKGPKGHEAPPLPNLTPAVIQADSEIMAANMRGDPRCPNKKDGRLRCWVPAWNPRIHMALDYNFEARFVWAAAWASKKDPAVNLKVPPKVPPFIQSGPMDSKPAQFSLAQTPADSKRRITINLCSESESEADEVKEVRNQDSKPNTNVHGARVKGAPFGDVTNVAAPRPKSTNETVNTPRKRERDDEMPRFGPDMTLDDFCHQYDLDFDIRNKLLAYKATTPYAVSLLDADQLIGAKLVMAEPARVTAAVLLWKQDSLTNGSPRKKRVTVDCSTINADAESNHLATSATTAPLSSIPSSSSLSSIASTSSLSSNESS
ncbi:hypothetical protein CF335_g8953 [Tilletia laevis]|nr:hypothetical protein CF335_g8953 [Tilletia laevis]